jgi:hypothetical protein
VAQAGCARGDPGNIYNGEHANGEGVPIELQGVERALGVPPPDTRYTAQSDPDYVGHTQRINQASQNAVNAQQRIDAAAARRDASNDPIVRAYAQRQISDAQRDRQSALGTVSIENELRRAYAAAHPK